MKLETYNYCRKATHHAKRYFDPTTWVVWANTQFATARFLSVFFGLFIKGQGHTSAGGVGLQVDATAQVSSFV